MFQAIRSKKPLATAAASSSTALAPRLEARSLAVGVALTAAGAVARPAARLAAGLAVIGILASGAGCAAFGSASARGGDPEGAAKSAAPSERDGPLPGAQRPTKGVGMMFNFPPLEEGAPAPKPGYFIRARGAIGKAGDPIVAPTAYDTVLCEGELVIVIGKRATKVSVDQAEACILGYTCGMDGSPSVVDVAGEKDLARSLAGKSADGIAPVGPTLVRELRPEGHDIILRLNGEEVERANTRNLIWGPARIVSEISRAVTLEPGDVIFTGARRAVPKLSAGDVVEVEIEGVGHLRCPVVAP